MKKIDNDFVREQYQVAVDSYRALALNLGLWESERQLFEQYFHKTDKLLDIGCGTGRTTFGLFQLGYSSLTGLDLTPKMIEVAQDLNPTFNSQIEFMVGDASDLPFPAESFDGAIFSFNGLMSIPRAEARLKAVEEAYRVLKADKYWVFTTHDRGESPKYAAFWEQERLRWQRGKEPAEVFEFGDLITDSRNEPGKIFIHIPDYEEVAQLIHSGGFTLIDTFMRDNRVVESPEVKEASGDCRFWVVKKRVK